MKDKSLKEWITDICRWMYRPSIPTGYSVKYEQADLSQANNGISSGIHYPYFQILDKDGRIVARFEATINSNGNVGINMYSRNYNTSGVQIGQHGISNYITKSGAVDTLIDNVSTKGLIITQRKVQSLANQGSGNKTFTFTAPSGYTILGSAPYNCYLSGNASDYITDRTMSINSSTNVVTINYYAHIPATNANLQAVFDIFFIRKGFLT